MIVQRSKKIDANFSNWQAIVVAIALTGFCTASPLPAATDPLFIDTTENMELRAVDPAIVLRQRIVRIDYRQLQFSALPRSLVLNFFDDLELKAIQVDGDQSDSNAMHQVSWRGRIDHAQPGRVTLVRQADAVSIIAKVAERRYDVRPMENGLHVVQEIAMPRSSVVAGDETAPPKSGGRLSDGAIAAAVNGVAGMSDQADQVFTLTNQERAKYNLSAFTPDSRLVHVAQEHTQAQADADSMFHAADPGALYAEQEYYHAGWAENVAYGSPQSSYSTPEGVLAGWMGSTGHRNNILSDLCDLGVGRAVSNTGKVYWTQSFGTEQGDTQCAAPNPDDDDNDNPDTDTSTGDGGSSGCFFMIAAHPNSR